MDSATDLLAEVRKGMPQNASTPLELLRYNQELQKRLIAKSLELADGRWPGFQELLAKLMAKENDLIRQVGPLA